MPPVLITSPSLKTNVNVSGISALVRPLVERYPDQFHHLAVGTSDKDKSLLNRLTSFAKSICSLTISRFRIPRVSILHLNTAADAKSIPRDILLAIVARLLLLRVIVHFHGGRWLTSQDPTRVSIVLVRFLAFLSSNVIVLGDEEVGVLAERFNIKHRVSSILNFASPEFFEDSYRVHRNVNQLLFAGRLVESKRVDELHLILKQVLLRAPNTRLVICGDGPLREQLLHELQGIDANSWEYRGVLSGRDKLEAFMSSDVFILPSRSGEGMPVSMLEAIAAGCIPVVTDLGSIRSAVKSGVNGVVCDPDNSAEYIDSLVEVLIGDNKNAIRCASLANRAKFDISRFHSDLNKIYDTHQ